MSENNPAPEDVEKILATIRQLESSNNYRAKAEKSSASGAYQFIDDTWKRFTKKYGVGTEYPSARLAPPEVQDRVAALKVQEILTRHGGDVSKVPLVWYTGNPQGSMTQKQLRANQGQTAKEYKNKWFNIFNSDEAPAVPEEFPEPRPFVPAAASVKPEPKVAQAEPLDQLPESYRLALAANYLADTEDEPVVEKAMEMLEERQYEASTGGGKIPALAAFGQQQQSVDPFQFVLAQAEQEPRTTEQRRRPVPKMPQAFQNGGSASKSGVNRLKQARAVPAMPRFQDGGEVEQMTVGTLPTDQIPAGEALRNVRRDLVRGAQYLPYDLLGAPVDIINMALLPFGVGSEKPVGGSEWLIEKSAKAGIADEPTYSAPEMVSRVGMGFVNPATVARYAPRGIEALRKGAETLELPGVSQTAPVGAILPKQGIDRSVLLPTENKPFIGEVERIVADLPGPVTKEQFLNQMRKKGRNYEIARVEQALQGWEGNAKFTPAELMERLQATSPKRYTTEIVRPGERDMWNVQDNPFPSNKPGTVNLLLDLSPDAKKFVDLKTNLVDTIRNMHPLRLDLISTNVDEIVPVFTEAARLMGKNPDTFVVPLKESFRDYRLFKQARLANDNIEAPAGSETWRKYSFKPGKELPDDLKNDYGDLSANKLVGKIYKEELARLKRMAPDFPFDYQLPYEEINKLDNLSEMLLQDKVHFDSVKPEAMAATSKISDSLRRFQSDTYRSIDTLASRAADLANSIPTASFEGGHTTIASKNPISFSRFVEFTPNQADEFGISMPDQDRGAILFLELQSDRQKALRLNRNVEEAFPNMAGLSQVTQQLMIKNAIYGGIKMDKGLVLFPGSDSAQAQLYEKLGPNLKQVVKDLGPGFKAKEFKFPNESGKMATRWGVYIDEDAAKRVMTQGMRFAKGGMVDKPLYDRAA